MKKVDFSETIAACDLKLMDLMKILKVLDLGPRLCTYKNSNRIFSETTLPIRAKFFMNALRYKEMKI